jgi:hypothetical protein
MKSHPLVIALLVPTFLASGALLSQGRSAESPCALLFHAQRNLENYECGGTLVGGYSRTGLSPQSAIQNSNNFIWKHYTERKLGVISSRVYSIEGDRTDSTYYIEPDKDGHWIVAWVRERQLVNRHHIVNPKEPTVLPIDTNEGIAYSISRVFTNTANGRFDLHFTDRNGEPIAIVWK